MFGRFLNTPLQNHKRKVVSQKQPPQVFYKKPVHKNFAIFTEKHLYWSLLSIKKRLQHRCFPVDIAKFLRTLILKIVCERLLLVSDMFIVVSKTTVEKIQNYYRNTEAVVQRCSVKKVFLEISQNSQENTCARASFLIKLQASRPATVLKKRI